MFYAMLNAIKELDKISQGLNNNIKSINSRLKKIEDKIAALFKANKITSQNIKNIGSEQDKIDVENKQLESESEKLELRLNRLETQTK